MPYPLREERAEIEWSLRLLLEDGDDTCSGQTELAEDGGDVTPERKRTILRLDRGRGKDGIARFQFANLCIAADGRAIGSQDVGLALVGVLAQTSRLLDVILCRRTRLVKDGCWIPDAAGYQDGRGSQGDR